MNTIVCLLYIYFIAYRIIDSKIYHFFYVLHILCCKIMPYISRVCIKCNSNRYFHRYQLFANCNPICFAAHVNMIFLPLANPKGLNVLPVPVGADIVSIVFIRLVIETNVFDAHTIANHGIYISFHFFHFSYAFSINFVFDTFFLYLLTTNKYSFT